jgi:cell wall assembly regulator SMI1
MTPATLQRLDDIFERMHVLRAEPVPVGEIDVAEQSLGIKFPADYREFLRRYGGAVVGSLPILGLRQAEAMGSDTYSVVDVTAKFRADRWKPTESWAVISVDLAGNPIGITSNGQVWISDHDVGDVRLVAPTFEQFITTLLP